ncbi:hypothetical protein [Ekhidna sp.]|uniref:hypothetical protein n=1 Tax=Ekhidna sp. TaxID=2608089 RepID=UPI0032979CCD
MNSSKKVLLDGYFIVSDKGEVIDSHNRSDSNTVESPTGYTKIGSCSNSGDKAMCIGDILHTYLSESLSGLEDCAATSVSVGMTSTTVYGKACS